MSTDEGLSSAGLVGSIYGGRVRVRVCGLAFEGTSILLVQHAGLSKTKGGVWMPPGGGVHYGESMEKALKREFREETGLNIDVKQMAFVCEFIEKPLHAVEFFFDIHIKGGQLRLGKDPEMPNVKHLTDVKWWKPDDIAQRKTHEFHPCITQSNRLKRRATKRTQIFYSFATSSF